MNLRLGLLTLACLGWCSQAAAYNESWVRQTDLATGLVYDMPIQSEGTSNYGAPLAVSQTGARFELFARGTAWDSKIYLLDTKIIRAYTPVATVTIDSEDGYVRGDPSSGTYVKRTRVDRPFTVRVNVSGLVPTSPNVSERTVYFGVKGRNYDPTTYSALNLPQYLLHEYNLSNGELAPGATYHELTPGGLTTACGEQTYTLVRYASDGIPDTTVAEPKIEVWPLATASVDKITAGQIFNDRLPPIPITLKNLYPDSRTYVQIYAGSAVLGTQGAIVGGTDRRYGKYYNSDQAEEPTNVPQNVSLSIEDLSKYAAADGIYTLEVITHTPFFNREPERLLTVTFEVDRVISARGQLSTTEVQSVSP
jgi:hypothetical protein